jgi:DNA-binding response OmpR family regulator
MSIPRILVVDDDATVRSILGSFLSAQGYRVTPCAGGEAMWAALSAGPADLVVLDVEMPGEDGYSLARRLRQVSGVGIILLTSHTEIEHKLHGLEIGADEFLSKPADRRELLARIKSLLRRVAAPAPRGPAVRPDNCPSCGSRLRWSLESEAGAIGSCPACSWSKFYEG